MGFTVPWAIAWTSGALLPHLFTLTQKFTFSGGLFSVALSLRLLWPGVTRHRVFVEPGLSSVLKQHSDNLTPLKNRLH
jgi:hypothetical protein